MAGRQTAGPVGQRGGKVVIFFENDIIWDERITMKNIKDYTTFIPMDDRLLEIKVKVLPRGSKNKSRWEEVYQWGKNFSKTNRLKSSRIDKVIFQRRYGKS